MASITTRVGKGSPLSTQELDANFTNLNADKLEKSLTGYNAATSLDGTELLPVVQGGETKKATMTAIQQAVRDYLISIGADVPYTPLYLFENSEQGAWYDPSDLTTLFQDSAGTTPVTAVEQPVGLMLDKSKGLVLGSEVLAALSAYSVVLTGTWAASGSDWVFTDTIGSQARPGVISSVSLTSGLFYKAQITIASITGATNVRIDGIGATDILRGVGSHTFYFLGTGVGSVRIRLEDLTTSINDGFAITSFSIKALPGNHAYQPTSAARPVLKGGLARIQFDKVDDNLGTTFASTITGTMIVAMQEGILHAEVNIPAGAWSYTVTPAYMLSNNFAGMVVRNGVLSSQQLAQALHYFTEKIGGDGKFASLTALTSAFRNRTDITKIYAGAWDTANVTTFYAFAYNCTNLTTIDVSSWNTANVTNFANFVRTCTNLTTLDVSSWNTANVTDFSNFANACTNLTTLDVSNWNIANVTTFYSFAYGCASLTTLDVSSWNTANVTTFYGFAYNCTNLTTITVGTAFDASPCTNYTNSFKDCALNQASVDAILVSINNAGTSNGTLNMNGGTSATPSVTGLAAKTALQSRGWTVTTN